VRHNYISVNIILEIMKYKIYECELKNNDSMSVEKLVISRDLLNLRKGYTIKFRLLNNDILLAIESDKK
jgi:hypothetical protein